jgi:foldase protein PrsA
MKNTKEKKTNKEKKEESTKTSKKLSVITQWYKSNKVMALGILLAMLAFVSGYYLKGLVVAATVNGEPIWRYKVIKELETYYGANVIDNLITQKLIEKEGREKGITVGEEEIANAIKELETNMGNSGTNLDEALKESNMTRKDLEEDYRISILMEKIIEARVNVTDEEAQTYLDENQDSIPEGTTIEQVKNQLTQEKMGLEYNTFIQEIREKANVNSMVDYYTFN